MEKTTINKLSKHVGNEVELNGWVYNTRNIGKIWFIILRDGTGLLQGVAVKGEVSEDVFNLEQTLNKEDYMDEALVECNDGLKNVLKFFQTILT